MELNYWYKDQTTATVNDLRASLSADKGRPIRHSLEKTLNF